MDEYSRYNTLLNKKLLALSEKNEDYWSFKGNSNRDYGHGLFQYPAMMVPQVTQAIIENIIEVHPGIMKIYDPFVGSGTVMTESMIKGLSFYGTDVNPLAILLCQVKSGPFYINKLIVKSEELTKKIKADKKTNYEIDYYNKNKWFTKSTLICLSKIKRSIKLENELWARKFFWIVLAETIRLTSNSRTSTFKLHIRTDEDISYRKDNINVIDVFINVLNNNIIEYTNLYTKLEEKNYLYNGRFTKDIQIVSTDVKDVCNLVKADIIITSPPYGDNTTTVPYGQHSFLPLQWIDFSDIDKTLKKELLLKTTNEIDRRSLGGRKNIDEDEKKELIQKSNSLKKYLENIPDKPEDKPTKVLTFFRDLNNCIAPILQNLNNGGIMVWVLGNRMVCGKQVPLDNILSDLLEWHNVSVFCKLSRKIPLKRMAQKNNFAKTMSDEVILLMRKGG